MANKAPFRKIGHGNCGSVWAVDQDGPAWSMKFEDGSIHRDIKHEARMHQQIEAAQEALRNSNNISYIAIAIKISTFGALIPKDYQEWWKERLPRLPRERQPCNTLVSERIPPFGREVRERLIDRYCPEEFRDRIKACANDEDCLLRCYIGRKEHKTKRETEGRRSMFTGFTLRNFPLNLSQMQELGCDVDGYAEVMADTLAMLHWKAGVDAEDVEFVLAPPSNHEGKAQGRVFDNEVLGKHCVWLLDFDCVKELDTSKEGIEKAIRMHYINDPYYPRFNSGEMDDESDRLYACIFRPKYWQSSLRITGNQALVDAMAEEMSKQGSERKSLHSYGLSKGGDTTTYLG